VLHAKNEGWTAQRAAAAVGLTADQVERVYHDIDQKRSTTAYLHSRPLLVEPIPQLHPPGEERA
jgi:NAD+ synthase